MKQQQQRRYWRSLPLECRTGSQVFNCLFRQTDSIATLLESPYPTPSDQPQLSRYSICAGMPQIYQGCPQMWTPPVGEILPFLGRLLSFSSKQQTKNTQEEEIQRHPDTETPRRTQGNDPNNSQFGIRNNSELIETQAPNELPVSGEQELGNEFTLPPQFIPNLVDVPPPHLPFTGGWLGWLGYDLAWEIEQLPDLKSDPLPFPVAFWYEPAAFAVLDHVQQILWLAANSEAELDQLEQRLEQDENHSSPTPHTLPLTPNFQDRPHELRAQRSHENSSSPTPDSRLPTPYCQSSKLNVERWQDNLQPSNVQSSTPTPPSTLCFLSSQTDFEAAVVQAKKYIQAGDIFQANLSLRFEAQTSAESWAIYRALQQINPSPFASYWKTPWGEVISCSPERLVHLEGRQAQTRPIAGTRSRGNTTDIDQQLEQELIANAKERAEHIMLVDLERNDLGRVCQWGSVEVNELFTIERYSHVMHLVSNVKGMLRDECDAVDLIRALFPGGTITGCPKVRAIEIIEELEPVRRSLFYGSCGYIDQRGSLDLNILIRTLLFSDQSSLQPSTSKVWGQVGAGIVADSDPEHEWYESLHKAQAQLAALKIFRSQG